MVPPLSLSLSGGPFGQTRSSTHDKETLIPALAGGASPLLGASVAEADRETPTGSAKNKPSSWVDGSETASRVLERQGTSMAISIGTPATPGLNAPDAPDDVQVPLGFTFTGDLDEDVDSSRLLRLTTNQAMHFRVAVIMKQSTTREPAARARPAR